MAQHNTTDYAFLAKSGFLAGVCLVAIGMLGGLVAPVIFGTLPQWEYTLFFYAEVAGILTGFLSPVL